MSSASSFQSDQLNFPIPPHGGQLVNRLASGEERSEWLARRPELPRLSVRLRERCDLDMLAIGAYSPLTGFLTRAVYERVVGEMRLANGLLWSIPITLGVSRQQADQLREGDNVALYDELGDPLAILHLQEKYLPDKRREAVEVYRTEDLAHPGVEYIYKQGEVLLGGPITALQRPRQELYPEWHYTPAELRTVFRERGWRRVVAFQTRNPIHRAHEYLTKCALEIVDGLLIHPLVGETKGDDVPAPIRVRSYLAILERYYPQDRVILSLWGASMRYAGPREAVHHALVRKNYGCTHFIVGRDHAGVGKYYGTYDAQRIFDDIELQDLGITPLFFEHTFYCRQCGMASYKTCPCPAENRLMLSGTQVRAMLTRGECPPPEYTRPEVAQILIEGYRQMLQGAA
ncbi:MAG: sulfate adenylyltransferase [Gemmatales bacterium]|nr:sulfate adenylyltransferase [Gemmatales bacterium]MDW8174239.1 sulfate adenylyltransferase [Gemmatales bacterium]